MTDPIYLDCNATTPLEPEVRDIIWRWMVEDYGNAASRTHIWGTRAKQAVEHAREAVARVVAAKADEVIFTSGATESNNLALLGLAAHGVSSGSQHIVTSPIEHKAVLEPIEYLRSRGFKVTVVPVDEKGWVAPADVARAVREDTLFVSLMHANNETGVLQPLQEICEVLGDHPAYLHVDAAQGFGKDLEPLKSPRIDLMSISGHKIYGPKGIGALVTRRRGYKKLPLSPLMFGGGHERGLRPGTLPVPLIAGLGQAASIALRDNAERKQKCLEIRKQALDALVSIGGAINGDESRMLPHVLNISFPGVDSEAAIVALKDHVAISNGSACTSLSYDLSHVLVGMGLAEERIRGALRMSWCHMTTEINWADVALKIKLIM